MTFVSIIYRRTFLNLRYKLHFHSLSEWQMHLDNGFQVVVPTYFHKGAAFLKPPLLLQGDAKPCRRSPFCVVNKRGPWENSPPKVFWPFTCFPFKNTLLVRPRCAKDVQWFPCVIGSMSQKWRPEVGHLAPKALKTRRLFKDLRA